MFRRKWVWAPGYGPPTWRERLKSFIAVCISLGVFAVVFYFAPKMGAEWTVTWLNAKMQ